MKEPVHFTIQVKIHYTGKKYRMRTAHIYSSEQVERFKVFGKDERFIMMEKRLSLHRQPWKITSGNIAISNIQEAAMAVQYIQEAIDEYLDKRKKNRAGGSIDP